MTGTRISRSLTICAIVFALAAFATPALAQTGQIKGKVTDAQNKPVEGAIITMQEEPGGQNRKYTTKTDRNGEYIQIGIQSGIYSVQADKDKLSQAFQVRIAGDAKEVNFNLKPGAGGMSKEDMEKRVEGIKGKFSQAATLGNDGKYDEAIALYNEVLVDVPACQECYINIGAIHTRKKDWPAAEAAYRKAIELKADEPEPYNGLANVYNAQQKFKEAAEASAEASKRMAAAPGGAGASANILYNQGAIAWNANDFPKAKEHFEAAVKADPNYAEAHFMLGKVNLNLGKLPEAMASFQSYVKVAPTGQNAKEAQTFIDQLKGIVK